MFQLVCGISWSYTFYRPDMSNCGEQDYYLDYEDIGSSIDYVDV
jgi:hypothetical protein